MKHRDPGSVLIDYHGEDRPSFLKVEGLASEDPRSTARRVASVREDRTRHTLLSIVAHTWAEADHHEALKWAESLDDADDRHHVIAEIARWASSSDPQLALHIAAKLPDSSKRAALIRDCLHQWAMDDPEAAAEWARLASDPADRTAAVATVACTWARHDPGAAITLAIENIPGEAALADALPGLIAEAAITDLPMLREWLHSFAEGPLKDLTRAELTRIERNLPPSPASLPGEGEEERTPARSSANPTKNNP